MTVLLMVLGSVLATLAYAGIGGAVYRRVALDFAWRRADSYRQKFPDASDIRKAKGEALWWGVLWPLTAVLSLVLLASSAGGKLAGLNKDIDFCERPKRIQGPVASVKNRRADKRKREAEERRMATAERRIAINKSERENNMTLTTWED